jgi:sugar phosphate isomerase/epimerase
MAEIDNLVEKINEWQPKLAAMGINLHYHNHWQEFVPNPDGSITMDELEKRTNVLFEIDTYWAYVAGEDPVKVLDKYGDRVKFIHLKDGFKNKEGKSLGQGTAPVKEVLAKAEATGRTIVVESEGLDPTGKEEVKRCIDFLMAQ